MKELLPESVEAVPEIDARLKEKELRGVLIGSVARKVRGVLDNLGNRVDEKDIDVVLLDQFHGHNERLNGAWMLDGLLAVREDLTDLDIFHRLDFDKSDFNAKRVAHQIEYSTCPYWISLRTGSMLNWTIPKLDQRLFMIPPGLHIPDSTFLTQADTGEAIKGLPLGIFDLEANTFSGQDICAIQQYDSVRHPYGLLSRPL